jgi:hypothetical protein
MNFRFITNNCEKAATLEIIQKIIQIIQKIIQKIKKCNK